jgi:type I restriction enzyme S subunit
MKTSRLDEICEVIAGQSPPSETYNSEGEGIPFFQGKADFGSFYPTVRYWCNKPTKISLPNDILFSVRAPVGPTNINNIEACIGRGLSAIRCKRDVVVMKYLLHYLRTNENKIADLGTGSTFKAITISELKKLQIPLPPLDQQKKIASILDAADAYMQKTKALIKKYDELTQSLFLDMFGDPVKNEKGWEKVKMSKFCEFENGDRSSNYPSGDDIKQTGKLFLSSGDIQKGKFKVRDSKFISLEKFNSIKRGKCRRGDILMTLRGNGTGKSAVFDCQYDEGFINAQMVIIRPNDKCLSNYLVFQLNFPQIFKKLINLNSGSAQPQLSASSVKEFEVFLPCIDLQNQFAERVQAIEQQKARAQASYEKAEELFNSLLQKAFNGELV